MGLAPAGPSRWSAFFLSPWLGGIAIRSRPPGLSAWGWLLADAAFFAWPRWLKRLPSAATDFQRFERAVGPVGAGTGLCRLSTPLCRRSCRAQATPASPSPSRFSSAALQAYLRTRALWLSWGLNFGWKASRALLFGLAVSGVNSHSPVVQGDPMGPFWLTGGGFGLDGSWITLCVLLLALPVVFRITRDLDFIATTLR
jgi:uncharacterized protein